MRESDVKQKSDHQWFSVRDSLKQNDVLQKHNDTRESDVKRKSDYQWFSVRDLSWDIEENDLYQGLSAIGEVKYVDIIDPEFANICIKLSSEFTDKSVIKFSMKGESYQLLEKCFPNFKIKDEVSLYFNDNRQHFFNTLYLNADKEEKSSIDVLGEKFLKTKTVEDDLTRILSSIKRVIIIGSRATGLASQSDSVLDLYVEIGNNYFENECDQKELSRRLREIESGLKKSTRYFKDVKIINNSIETVHCLTLMKCKIFCGNGLIVEKSELIRVFVNSDERIKQLILIIKEWAKYSNLSEITSNYTLTWIVIYYLIKSSFIEPVISLRKNSKIQRKISGWECGFEASSSSIIKSKSNLKTTDNLLKGFFEFYGNDECILSVHCPWTGESFLKAEFKKLHLPCPEYENYIKFCSFSSSDQQFQITKNLCLQDPIELNKNLTDNFMEKSGLKFKWFCKRMHEMLDTSD